MKQNRRLFDVAHLPEAKIRRVKPRVKSRSSDYAKIHRRYASNEKDPLPQKRRSERSTVEGQRCRTILATSREARPGGMAPTSSPCDPPDCCPAGCPSSSVRADPFANRGCCSHKVQVEIRRNTNGNGKVSLRITS